MRRPDGTWDVFDDYVIDFAIDRIGARERIALVTLVAIEGTSPRPLGAQMAVSETGQWVGYLSGGCIEGAVVEEALSTIREGHHRLVRYGRGSKYVDIQLPCGSAIDLSFNVEFSRHDLLAIDSKLKGRAPARLEIPVGGLDGETMTIFERAYRPRRRIIILGVGAAAIQLAKMASASGFEVVFYTPDSPTMNMASTCAIEAVHGMRRSSMPTLDTDRQTAIVLMFHDHEWERDLWPSILGDEPFYIGALGSRVTHRKRLEDLARDGYTRDQLKRIRGPAGLFFGLKNASDIAISILAEITQVHADKLSSASTA